MIAYCADVGSVRRGAFGWARARREEAGTLVKGGSSVDALVSLIEGDLRKGLPLSLGIEAPLFIPVPVGERDLSWGRDGERDRSCFAPPGGYVTTLGLHELAYILSRLKARVPHLRATLDWTTWNSGAYADGTILVWEALVTKDGHTKTGDHAQDAASAAVRFINDLEAGLTTAVTVKAPREVFSLAGAALLWAGLAAGLDELRKPTLVVRPTEPWPGSIERL
jgi:hypothetical protein